MSCSKGKKKRMTELGCVVVARVATPGDCTMCVVVARVGLGIAPCVWLLQGDCTVCVAVARGLHRVCGCCKGGSGDCVAVARVGLGIAPCVWLLQGWVWGLHRVCCCCKGVIVAGCGQTWGLHCTKIN